MNTFEKSECEKRKQIRKKKTNLRKKQNNAMKSLEATNSKGHKKLRSLKKERKYPAAATKKDFQNMKKKHTRKKTYQDNYHFAKK